MKRWLRARLPNPLPMMQRARKLTCLHSGSKRDVFPGEQEKGRNEVTAAHLPHGLPPRPPHLLQTVPIGATHTVTAGPHVAPGGLVQGGVPETGGPGVPAIGSQPSKNGCCPSRIFDLSWPQSTFFLFLTF